VDESKKFAVLVLGEQVVGEQDVQDRVRLNFCDICVQKLQTVLDERGIDFLREINDDEKAGTRMLTF